MDGRCKGCIVDKKNYGCLLTEIVKVRPDLVDCPCFECIVKVTCNEQCEVRTAYFLNNINTLQVRVGEIEIEVGGITI
jgi:hypothetical protein